MYVAVGKICLEAARFEVTYRMRFHCSALACVVLGLVLVLSACDAGDEGPVTPEDGVSSLAPDRSTSGATEATEATEAGPESLPSGHLRMGERLDAIARSAADEHFFQGDKTARELRAALSRLPSDAPSQQRWKLHHQAGVVELRLGEVRESIRHFTQAYELFEAASLPARWRSRTRFDLAIAYLRLGEVENCCQRGAAESCILPLRGAARHARKEGSLQAIRFFGEVLDESSEDERLAMQARWLLNVAHMTLGTHPEGVPERHRIPLSALRSGGSSTESERSAPFPRFVNVATALGLDTFNLSGGAIVDDFDGDGYLDILTSTWDTQENGRLFFNQRDGTFSQRDRSGGLPELRGGLNMKQADYDGDGTLDVLVLRGAWLGPRGRYPNSLLRGRGDGSFVDVTFDAGLAEVNYPTQTAAWADYDNDGDLDVYVGNESTPRLEAPSQLFRNNGDGTFTDVASSAKVAQRAFTKGVTWGDFDGDRWPDLYVSNLRGPNRLYHNQGDGTFLDVAESLGVTRPEHSFPAWFWDFDNDGALDLFVSSYRGRVETVAAHYLGKTVSEGLAHLYRGDGRGGFLEVAAAQGLGYPVLTMGSNYGDLNGDGYLDFYLGTGDPDFWSLMPNLMFLNRGGTGFDNVTYEGGFGHLQKGHAVSFADVDNDGDLDVFQQMGGAYRGDAFYDAFYENPGFGNHWLTIEVVGTRSNRSGIGARIQVDVSEDGEERSIYRHVTSGGSFGANPLRQTIGLGKADVVRQLTVYWPTTNATQRFSDVGLDRALRIREGDTAPIPLRFERLELATDGAAPNSPRPAGPGGRRE